MQSETAQQIDAVARVHILQQIEEALMTGFKQKIGMTTHECRLPNQTYCENSEEKLHDGRVKPEPQAQEISLAEESKHEMTKPEVLKTLGLLYVNCTLSIQSKKRHMSAMPFCVEELRQKYDVRTNIWLLVQMRHPNPKLHSDLSKDTWTDVLRDLLT